MKAYRIVEWLERYEVTEKGKAAGPDTPIENLRKSPLPYVRFKVYGHAHGPAYRKIVRRAWVSGQAMELAVFGLFAKLLELAANQMRGFRGWILDEKQQPMNAQQIAETLDVQEVQSVKRALEILCDPAIGWVENLEFPGSPQNSSTDGGALWGKEGEPCGGKKGTLTWEPFKNETETKVNENKVKESPACSGADSDSVSDSSQKGADSASVPWGTRERKKKIFTYEVVSQVIKPLCDSDRTTLRHIFEKIEEQIKSGFFDLDIYNQVEEAATECIDAKNRMAMFVAVAKERFGYQPKRDRILQRAFR